MSVRKDLSNDQVSDKIVMQQLNNEKNEEVIEEMIEEMFNPLDHQNLINDMNDLMRRGYLVSDLAILYDLPMSQAVDEILRFDESGRLERRSTSLKSQEEMRSRISSMTKDELLFMYNDVVVRKLNQIDCMKKFDIPYSYAKDVEDRLLDLKLDHKKNFLKKSKYYNEDSQISTFLKLTKFDESLANHYKMYYLEKFNFTDEFVKQAHDLQLTYTLSIEELSYKFNVSSQNLRSIFWLYYERISYQMISDRDCYELLIKNYSKNYIADILNKLKLAEISDLQASMMLNVRFKIWRKIKSQLLDYCDIDQRAYDLEKKNSWTIKTLNHKFGQHITNVAQIDKVKEKTSNTINSIRIPMTRELSIDDEHPKYYRFSEYSEKDLENELFDLIINRGYRAEDITKISDIDDTQDITRFNQSKNLITQLTTGDYNVRINAQLDKFRNATIEQLDKLNKKLENQHISSITDICFALDLPFRAFENLIKIENCTYVYVNDSGEIIFPVSLSMSKLSSYEAPVSRLLDELDIKYEIQNRKILKGLELDFYLPDHKIAIEINPSYTHNSNKYVMSWNDSNQISKTKSYHFDKYLMSKDCGITLIQLYEWDFLRGSLVSSSANRLASILKPSRIVYARKCEIKQIDARTARIFLDEYHTNGYANSIHKYGLFYDNELLAVATFSKPFKSKTNSEYDFELKRLAFKTNVKVMGGTSKIISKFFKDHPDVNAIYSYSDNDWGSGSSYEKSGFKFLLETGPSLTFVARHSRSHEDRYSWQITMSTKSQKSVVGSDRLKKGLDLESDFNVDEYIETELSHRFGNLKGYDRIYTSGSKKWEYKRS